MANATDSLRRPVGLIAGFLAVPILLFGVFFVYPMLQVIWMSFHEGSVTAGKVGAWVGLENYRQMWHDETFWQMLWHNVQLVLIGGVTTLVLALSTAVGLTKIKRGRDFFRTVFLFPNIISVVATAILWSFIFNPSFGLVNGLLRVIGLEQYTRAWLGEPGTALPVVIFIHIWTTVGFYIVLFYAGLMRIPADYSEAARIDGASGWQEFRHITLPLLQDILQMATLYVIINSVNVFALVFVLNESRSARYNGVLLTYMYEKGFQIGNYGYACALGVVTLITVLICAGLVSLLFRKEAVDL